MQTDYQEKPQRRNEPTSASGRGEQEPQSGGRRFSFHGMQHFFPPSLLLLLANLKGIVGYLPSILGIPGKMGETGRQEVSRRQEVKSRTTQIAMSRAFPFVFLNQYERRCEMFLRLISIL